MSVETRKRADAVRNREAVLEAAIRLLAERPDASMRDVADASGLGRTTVYRHFSTREELVDALFERVVREAGELMVAAAAGGGDARRVLRTVASELINLGERFRFLEHHRAEREQRRAGRGDTPPPEGDPYRRWFSEAQAAGDLRGDLPVHWMLAMVRGTSTAAIDEMLAGRVAPPDCARMLGDTFVAAFVAD